MNDTTKKPEDSAEGKPGDATKSKPTEPVVESTPTSASTETPATDNPLTARFKELNVPDDVAKKIVTDLGAETPEDLASLTEKDLIEAGMKAIPARKLVEACKPEEKAAVSAVAAGPINFDILPNVPPDESWLKALRSGGVLKVEESTVISTIRAALAYRAGLYKVPKLLVDAMEAHTEVTEEQVDPDYYKIRDSLTKTNYGDLFAAIPGMTGTYVTKGRKDQLLDRIDEVFWPAITSFNDQLKSWQEAWVAGAGNPAMMMMALAGGSGTPMPPGMMSPPDTGVLRDSSEAVNDAINKVFRGTGVQIASALAYEANNIKEMLSNSRLPVLCGLANRELMLKKLGVSVSATYPRMEQNLTKFSMAVMQAANVASGDEELRYYGTLFMLGAQIPWDDIGGMNGVVSGGRKRRRPSGIGEGEL